jgi:hypothetical protein
MKLSQTKIILPVIVGIAVIIFALQPAQAVGIYDTFPNFDSILHLSGGFIIAWFFGQYFKSQLSNLIQWQRIFFLISFGASIGIAWEFAEFLSSMAGPDTFPIIYNHFHIGNLSDTLGDLLADMTGALLYGIVSFHRKQQ